MHFTCITGSEDNITSYSAWVAGTKDNPCCSWVDYDFEDDASSSRPHEPWTRGDDALEDSNRNKASEEEESAKEDEESNDEPADATRSEE